MKRLKSNFWLRLYIQHNRTVLFKTTGFHNVITYEKMGRMDKGQQIFEQLSLSYFKKWSSTFNNYSKLKT